MKKIVRILAKTLVGAIALILITSAIAALIYLVLFVATHRTAIVTITLWSLVAAWVCYSLGSMVIKEIAKKLEHRKFKKEFYD